MATSRSSRRAMPTSGVGFLINYRPLAMQSEIVTGRWTVHPLHRALQGVSKANEGEEKGALSYKLATQSTTSYSIEQHCAGQSEPSNFAGSFLSPRIETSCERIWWTA